MVSQCRHELNEQATKSFRILCADSEEISFSRHVRVVVQLGFVEWILAVVLLQEEGKVEACWNGMVQAAGVSAFVLILKVYSSARNHIVRSGPHG
jgi:hypothetical protein